MLKQEQIVNGVRKLVSLLIKLIFKEPLEGSCLKHKQGFLHHFSKYIWIYESLDICTRKQNKNTEEEHHFFLHCNQNVQ